jgi:hypothetical protein
MNDNFLYFQTSEASPEKWLPIRKLRLEGEGSDLTELRRRGDRAVLSLVLCLIRSILS